MSDAWKEEERKMEGGGSRQGNRCGEYCPLLWHEVPFATICEDRYMLLAPVSYLEIMTPTTPSLHLPFIPRFPYLAFDIQHPLFVSPAEL